MSEYLCWRPDHGETQEDGYTIARSSWDGAEDAALQWIEDNFSNWDYPTEETIHVRELNGSAKPVGPVRVFHIFVESRPVFRAREVKS